MDDGAILPPGGPEPTGIGISQEHVHDMTAKRTAPCKEIHRALQGMKLPEGMTLEDLFWEE